MSDKKPYPNLKDYKRHKRSYQIGKNIRLSEKNLELANPNGLIRLATWLGVLPEKKDRFDSEWIQKIRCAIARKEKRLFGLPNQGREEEKMSKIELIKKLRVLTNAPMGDCLTALGESKDDFDKAVDWLKVKGLNAGGKVAEELTEGRIAIFHPCAKNFLLLVEIRCQTDFCAKSELIKEYTEKVCLAVQDALEITSEPKNECVEHLSFLSLEKELSYKVGETTKIKVHYEEFSPTEYIHSYVHSNGKIGTFVKFEKLNTDAYDAGVAENLCMQIAATNVLSISPQDLPVEAIVRQKAILEEQTRLLNKPESAFSKILEGKKNKWYSEVCLMKQECVWLPKVSIEKYLKDQEAICGHPIVVKKFVKFSI